METPKTREEEWIEFSNKVLEHIRLYTVPQYGDKGEDQIEKYTAAECITILAKYPARFGNNMREGQGLLDMLKTAHFACTTYWKLIEEGEQSIKSKIKVKSFEELISIMREYDFSTIDVEILLSSKNKS